MRKIKNILVVVFIFVVTLNINYLGMMDKRIIVESSEYKAGNTSNLVLNKILSDNELKTEIPKMFNYASNGMQYRVSEANPDYITNGLYSSTDEDGTTYYYRGDIDNNNLVFGTYDEDYYVYSNDVLGYFQTKESCIEAGGNDNSCKPFKIASKGEKMYWKIVRVNGDGSLRLIYNNCVNITTGEISHMVDGGVNGSLLCGVGITPYNLERNDPKYTGYTYDNGTDSYIKKEVDTWYNNTLGSNSLYDSKVILGRYCSDSSGYRYDETAVGNIFSSIDRLGQAGYNFAKDNAPSFICPSTNESYGGSYRLKAGLITADELVYAGESLSVTGNSYLNLREGVLAYRSMTPLMYAGSYAIVWLESNSLTNNDVGYNGAVRPVINLTTESMTLTGDGTIDNPYMLAE